MSQTSSIDPNRPLSRATRAETAELFEPSAAALEHLRESLAGPSHERARRERELGVGGMGKVDLIFDEALQRRLARKVLHPELHGNLGMTWLFLREARITAQLEHPAILPVHEIGQDAAGHFYFTMKRVEGQSLNEYVRGLPWGRLPRRTLFHLLEAVLKVCDAITFAHHHGVLHCDLKPDHVMLGNFGQVYLMDWGIARVLPEATATRASSALRGIAEHEHEPTDLILGTIDYMPPEQTWGRADLDARVDVFGLGTLLYYILTRSAPYEPLNFGHGVELAREAKILAPSVLMGPENVPPELEHIVLRALSRKREDRYPTAEALADALRGFLRGEGEMPTTVFAEGEHIVHEGERGDAAFIIARGRCEAYRTVDGSRRSLTVMEPGDCFGELALLTDEKRSASVVALEGGVEVHVITRTVFQSEISEIRPWIAQMIRTMAGRFRATEH